MTPGPGVPRFRDTTHSILVAGAITLFFLVMSGLLWGTGGLTGRPLAASSHLSSLAVAAYRLTVGGALLVAYLTGAAHLGGRRRKATAVTAALPRGRAAWRRTVVVGVLAAGFQAGYFAAVSLISVSVATLVTIGTAPVLVVAAETARGVRLTAAKALTVAVALTGLALLVGGFPRGTAPGTMAAGVACAILSAAGFAAITLVCATPVEGLDELTMTGCAFLLGGLALTAATAVFGSGSGDTSALAFAPHAKSIALLLGLALVPTAIAYTTFFKGLRTAPASTAAVTALLEPLTGTILAALILGDRIGTLGLAGAALLAVSVLCTARIRA